MSLVHKILEIIFNFLIHISRPILSNYWLCRNPHDPNTYEDFYRAVFDYIYIVNGT